jgi:hypothetical protein
MTAKEDEMKWMANTSTEWLQTAFKARGHIPPPCFSWTSRNLRKGVASTSIAIKVPLNDIRYTGGWSKKSTTLETKYIDFAMPPSKAVYIFFEQMKRDTSVEPQEASGTPPRPREPGASTERRDSHLQRPSNAEYRRQLRGRPLKRWEDIFPTECRKKQRNAAQQRSAIDCGQNESKRWVLGIY